MEQYLNIKIYPRHSRSVLSGIYYLNIRTPERSAIKSKPYWIY